MHRGHDRKRATILGQNSMLGVFKPWRTEGERLAPLETEKLLIGCMLQQLPVPRSHLYLHITMDY
jgi:hypothetical protein